MEQDVSKPNRMLILATSRPPFLVLTPCCLLVAVAYAVADGVTIDYLHLLLIVIGALAAHVSVNMFNEFEDFSSGLDFSTQRTAFSGGSGTLPKMPTLAKAVHLGAVMSLLVTIAIGVYLVPIGGWPLLPIGLVGVMLIYFYTSQITRHPMVCLMAPGLAFGPLMICGAYSVLSGRNHPAVFGASLIVFFLVNNLLLLNQFPDAEADHSVGRRHLPIVIGRRKSAWVYLMFLIAAYGALLANIGLGWLPIAGAIGLLPLLIAKPLVKTLLSHYDDMQALQSAMASNVAITLATPVLIAAGVLWSNGWPG